ncbi:ImmA/IrrE family metallo-endopeptidase [Vreelandella venusta]|uniref:ImmA/IrrE family metallo-endopeptidase n=1 Tax=Vreelandella venusta TaxID=44935 RepID=UPI00200E9CAC|nr:ImmA/IrrE family metallo-endopeptidase [Halomonas venusta]UQI41435.1 ImmA/IrrE family metallo-endopeptidase [Halomonas venusta]
MKIDDSFDAFICNDQPESLSKKLENYRRYKNSLNKVGHYINNCADNVRFYKEFTGVNENTLYRKREDTNSSIVALWMSRVKSAVATFTSVNNVKSFKSIDKEELVEIARLSAEVGSIFTLEKELIKKGIILVLEPSIDGLKLDGCVYINSNKQAVVAMSLRMNRLDNFWFTLLHELAHLSLHSSQLRNPIFENLEESSNSLIEQQADKLSLQSFIPRSEWRTCSAKINFKKDDLFDFAHRMHIHPAVVAGRIRKETNRYDIFSDVVHEHNIKRMFGL